MSGSALAGSPGRGGDRRYDASPRTQLFKRVAIAAVIVAVVGDAAFLLIAANESRPSTANEIAAAAPPNQATPATVKAATPLVAKAAATPASPTSPDAFYAALSKLAQQTPVVPGATPSTPSVTTSPSAKSGAGKARVSRPGQRLRASRAKSTGG